MKYSFFTIQVLGLLPSQGEPLPPAEALRIGWPRLAGPYSNFQAVPVRFPLVDDLSKARLLWKNEELDLGRAKGGSQAYRRVEQFTAEEFARMGAPPGNWAGPVVAEGLVFAASWRPCGEEVSIQGSRVRLDAEDLVVAIDALTGKVRWRAVEAGGILKGGGKRQGFQVAPVFHRGILYTFGSTARLFAYEGATGKKIWVSEAHPARPREEQVRRQALAGLAEGKWIYTLCPNWCSSLVVAEEVLIAPDHQGGLIGLDLRTGERKWTRDGVLSRWATPSVWRCEEREYLLCANENGELRLLDPSSGRDRWKLEGLGPTWFTLAPGRTHVLVNVVSDSGGRGADRNPGRLGAIRITPSGGESAWLVGDGAEHRIPVWMDSGARVRILYQNGRFLVTNPWQGAGPTEKEAAGPLGGTALLLDEESGRVLCRFRPTGTWNDQLGGLAYWCGDRVLARADSFHGPRHGGRHPWTWWSTAGDRLERLPGSMDLAEFTNGYEVPMEAPFAGGLVFERTERGGIACYDLRSQ